MNKIRKNKDVTKNKIKYLLKKHQETKQVDDNKSSEE